MRERRYTTTVRDGGRGRLLVPVPFEPDAEWGVKPRHMVHGTVGGCRVRATVEHGAFVLGPAWGRDNPVDVGDEVEVVLEPEGPQRVDLPGDLAAALAAEPAAAAFFDGLAQFYRRAYLRWIEGTIGRPQVRAERVAEVVRLCAASIKTRPR